MMYAGSRMEQGSVSQAEHPAKHRDGRKGWRAFRLFQLDLDTEEWRTWDLGGKAWHRSEWRGDGQGFYYTRMRVIPGNWDIMEREFKQEKSGFSLKKELRF